MNEPHDTATPVANGHAVRWRTPQQAGFPIRWTVHTACGQVLKGVRHISDTLGTRIRCDPCRQHLHTAA